MNLNRSFHDISLTLISFLVLLIFVNIGINRAMFVDRTLENYEKAGIIAEFEDEKLKSSTWGAPYQLSSRVKQYVESQNIKDPVILFEPNGYYIENNERVRVPEPVTFYYYTGLRCVWTCSENVEEATHYVVVKNNMFDLYKFNNKQEIRDFVEHYSKYQNSL